MPFLPIATRELKQAARRRKTYRHRVAAIVLAIFAAFGILSPSIRGVTTPDKTGWLLFLVLSITTFVFSLLAGAFITADTLSEEKREGTLGLLFLTQLRGYDIVFGKLLASSLNAFYGLIGIIPVMAIALMFGGIMAGEFWRMTIVLLNTLFFSVTLGLFVSSFSRHGRRAWLGAIALLSFFAATPWLFVNFKTGWRTVSANGPALLIFSPVYSFCLVFDAIYRTASERFLSSLELQHLLAWLFLILASFILPRAWQEGATPRWKVRCGELWNRWTLGTAEQRKADRRQWLSISPMVWLAKRERHRRAFFWAFLVFFAAVWLGGYIFSDNSWVQPEMIFLTAFALHFIIKLWLTLESSRRLAEDKRSGALEVLLVTPLGVSEILHGVLRAARQQFLIPLGFVIAIDILLLMFGLNGANTSGQAAMTLTFFAFAGIFIADSYTLIWVGLWHGLSARNSTRAFLYSVLKVLTLPWGIFFVLGSVIALLFFYEVSSVDGWMIIVWFAVAYFADAILCGHAVHQLTERFRSAATQNFEVEEKNWWPSKIKNWIIR